MNCKLKNIFLFFLAETLGMEGNVIERRTSSVQQWNEARQSTVPSTSSTAVPAYSNIFVTPPVDVDSKKISDQDANELAALNIKDKHECMKNFDWVLNLIIKYVYSFILF